MQPLMPDSGTHERKSQTPTRVPTIGRFPHKSINQKRVPRFEQADRTFRIKSRQNGLHGRKTTNDYANRRPARYPC